MADLLSILSGAQSSLAAQRGLAATASHNIDNASTPGYARQTATIEAVTPADQVGGSFVGRGATLGAVSQARDRFLEAQLPRAFGDAARSSAEAAALSAFHGLDPGASGGLAAAVGGFYAGLRALAQNPADAGLRTSALGAARAMAQAFGRTGAEIEDARGGLDAQLAAATVDVNGEARAVASLNARIAELGETGATPNDLLDLRQRHLDRLAELAGAVPVATSSGAVDVTLPGGLALVAGDRAATLSTRPDPARGGHVELLLAPTDGAPAVPLPASALGGTVGGALAARDGALAAASEALDQLAVDLADSLNTAHAAGLAPDGSSGQPLLDVGTGVAGAARRMQVTVTDPAALATSSTGAAGDAGNVQALLATESAALAGGGDVSARVAGLVSSFGASSAAATATSEQDGAIRDHLSTLRESASGVSIDEELVTMQRAQRGYEAITKVIQAADQMMQVLLQIR